jgi:hypothetical protein
MPVRSITLSSRTAALHQRRFLRTIETGSPVDDAPPKGIGHNAGPPLGGGFVQFCWKKASQEAWKNPPREVVLRRLQRAQALGMTYREYTAIILDRGIHL